MRAVNLIPSELRGGSTKSASRSEGSAYAVLAVLGGLALLALLYGSARHQIKDRETQAATLATKAQRAQAAAAQLAPYTSFVSLREQRQQMVSQIVDSRFDWAHAMHEFGRVMPPGTSISSLAGTVGSGTTGGSSSASSAASTPAASTSAASTSAASTPAASTAAVTGGSSATPPGSVPTFTIDGCATSQAAVALTLERLRLIDGASAVTLQSSVKGGASGGSGSGGCPGTDAAFAIQMSFDPLPSESATTAARTRLTSATGGVR
jgi:Tfp pilus assembly protein PilN